jgi:hypothetical protein
VTRVFFPLDQQLELFERTCSEAVAKLAVELCGRLTPKDTETILKQLGGISFSDTSVWRRVQTWGAKIKALEELRQAAATALPQRGTVGPGAVPLSKKMGAGVDGVLIPLRKEGYTEVKVGCVFDIEQRPEKEPETEKVVERAHAVNLTYTAVLGGPDRFGKAIWAEAERRQFPYVIDNLLIADAAQWIWSTVVPEHFGTSRQAVDWYHATEHLHTVAHLVHGEGTAEAQRWVKAMEHPLYQGHTWRVVQTIKDLTHTPIRPSRINSKPRRGILKRTNGGCNIWNYAKTVFRLAVAWSKVDANNSACVSPVQACDGVGQAQRI